MSGTAWSSPVVTDTIVNYNAGLLARDLSAMCQQRTNQTADTAQVTGMIRWNDTNFNWESWSGSAWAALATTYGISISGTSATATNALSLGGNLASTFAALASPTFTGTPTLPTGSIGVTQTAGNSTTALATTAFVTTADNLKANLASPTFTGTPSLPTGTIGVTQTAGNNTTALATTAFVLANSASFPTGTRMTFNQTAAPSGWTKDTTAALDDSIMRIVIGTVGSGGSTAFTTFNAQTATAAYTLALADIPAHTHTFTKGSTAGSGADVSVAVSTTTVSATVSPTSQGSGGAHSHGMTTAIKYNDFIIASKN